MVFYQNRIIYPFRVYFRTNPNVLIIRKQLKEKTWGNVKLIHELGERNCIAYGTGYQVVPRFVRGKTINDTFQPALHMLFKVLCLTLDGMLPLARVLCKYNRVETITPANIAKVDQIKEKCAVYSKVFPKWDLEMD
ncbi:hypothetical protein EPI10_024319 [Gossypium australe]|uniref:Uncharacterized protein n=1 Tax=Gossypium australe TaxID=47621 RepID=A0A5B6VYA9_9ROSI|nr:hypothetical protein EPI10_024319 [Gossypium australe]